ncbi:cyclic nucleotide-binding domain-containing protein [Candidatus Binatia bacterium]|nr:cyclic nucleotide-binding domain-containing protein [Candidatus Binatia bacterium]
MAQPGLTLAEASPDVLRLPAPRVRRRILLTARVLIVVAALITLLAVHYLTAVTLSLFLIVGQGCIVIGALLAAGVAITDVFRRRGVTSLRFEPGETVFRQGDPGDLVYSIVSGEVEIIREMPDGEERLLATMGPGEYFGEMALISDAARTATVRARTSLEVVAMGRADFTTLYAYVPGLKQRVETIMRQRAADTARKTS